ncbi:osmolarity response regulator [Chromobacterium violaceum]|uniref:Osmolarity response regulator n=1 Tax=Chromobacterium violaceum TaxID=536 RepID=A0A447TGM7_CHRVL|nr:osmolarity response regulator [Chromobacterium violaceum]
MTNSDTLGTADVSSFRVLIVDDDPDLRDLLSDYLSRQDMVVSAVGDGEAMNRAWPNNRSTS